MRPRARDLRNLLYANSWDLELDSANRLMVPPPAREFAGLEKEVVITGAGDHLQLWDRKAFAELQRRRAVPFLRDYGEL